MRISDWSSDVCSSDLLMIDKTGAPKVIEFNVRFGDPETQPIMMRLRSELLEHIEHAIDGHLDRSRALWDARPALGVVMAAEGYPGKPSPGNMINTWDVPDVDDRKRKRLNSSH